MNERVPVFRSFGAPTARFTRAAGESPSERARLPLVPCARRASHEPPREPRMNELVPALLSFGAPTARLARTAGGIPS